MTKSQLILKLEGREVELKAGWMKVENNRLEITKGLGRGSWSLLQYDIATLERFWRSSKEAQSENPVS